MSQTEVMEVLRREEVEGIPAVVPYRRTRVYSDNGSQGNSTHSNGNGQGRLTKMLSRPSITTPEPPKPPKGIDYPTGDGKPVAETRFHYDDSKYAVDSSDIATEHLERVWVGGNDFVYYEEGNPKARVSPDCYIVLDVERRERINYKIWEEGGRVPSIVWEFTSRKTAKEDRERKYQLYERLGVQEYVLFDPRSEYLRPRLKGYRLVDGKYQPMVPDEQGRLRSETTGIVMYADGTLLRFIHPLTGEVIETRREAEVSKRVLVREMRRETARARGERRRAIRERQRAARQMTRAHWQRERAEQQAERAERAEAARAEQQVRADQEAARAEQQAARAEREAVRAEQETRRAERAEAARSEQEAELARLRAEVERLRNP